MKNCVFDIGNTRIKIALFDGEELLETFVLKSKEDLSGLMDRLNFERSIIASVANEDLTNFVISQVEHFLLLDHTTPLPIKNKYKTPDTLGKDRLANAVGAYHYFNKSNSLIIDAGTCLKIDFINHLNEYIGGIISPGLMMRFKALNTFTDKLPLVNPDEAVATEMGVDTLTSIHAGCFTGMNREIEATIVDFNRKYEDLKIIITGGDMAKLEKMGFSQKNSIFADRWLTLRGLNEILRYNV